MPSVGKVVAAEPFITCEAEDSTYTSCNHGSKLPVLVLIGGRTGDAVASNVEITFVVDWHCMHSVAVPG